MFAGAVVLEKQLMPTGDELLSFRFRIRATGVPLVSLASICDLEWIIHEGNVLATKCGHSRQAERTCVECGTQAAACALLALPPVSHTKTL
jgi:hypothetical protein